MNFFAVVGVSLGFLLAAALGFAKVSSPLVDRAPFVAPGVAAALAAAFLRPHPIGISWLDVAVTVVGVGIVAWAGTRAGPNFTLVASAMAAAAAMAGNRSTPVLAGLVAALPLGISFASRFSTEHAAAKLVGAIALPLGLASLPTSLPSRVPSTVGIIGGLIVIASARNGLGRVGRRRTALFVAASLTVAVVVAGFGTVAVLRARPHAENAIRLAEGALTTAESLKTAEAATALRNAASELNSAINDLRSPIALPARLLPGIAPNIRAVEDLAKDARALSTQAAKLAGRVDVGSLRPVGGKVDLAAYRALSPDVIATRAPLAVLKKTRDSVARDPWVAEPLKAKVRRFDEHLKRLDTDLETLDEALRFVPNLLGGSGTRHYLLVLPTPSEARGSGGLVGNYGEIVATDGKFELTKFGRNRDLEDNGTPRVLRKLQAPADYVARYTKFGAAFTWANMTMTPSFPAAAEAMANHYPQSGGVNVDGVISADPIALAAFLALLGPLNLPSWPEPLTAENAAGILLHDSYVSLAADKSERLTLLADTASGVWSKLTTSEVPEPAVFAKVLGPIARGRHLQMWMRDVKEQQYLGSLRIDGSVPPIAGDSFGVVVNNASANKIDWFLHRTVDYRVEFDPTVGTATAVATVTLRNDAPSAGEPDYVIGNDVQDIKLPKGGSRQYVSLYSALPITSWEVDGLAFPFEREKEVGRLVASGWIVIAPKSSVTMTVRLSGAVPNGARGVYRLDMFRQSLVRPDSTTAEVRFTRGSIVSFDGFTAVPDSIHGSLRSDAEGTSTLIAVGARQK